MSMTTRRTIVLFALFAAFSGGLIGCNLYHDLEQNQVEPENEQNAAPNNQHDNKQNADPSNQQNASTNQNGEQCSEGQTQPGCSCPDEETGHLECVDGSFGGECICEIDVENQNQEPEQNLCGGTAELRYQGEPIEELGVSCGPCEDGQIECDGDDAITCSGASPAEACLATGFVELTAIHDDWDYDHPLAGDRRLSVFLLEDYGGECRDALVEVDDPSVLQPVDGEDDIASPIDTTLESVPVGVDYTVVAVTHVDHGGTPVAFGVGCRDFQLSEEGDTETIDDLELQEVPIAFSENIRFRLTPHFRGDNPLLGRWHEIINNLDFGTNDIGSSLFGCYIGEGCDVGEMGAFAYVAVFWDDFFEPFRGQWGLSDLWTHIENIDQASGAIHHENDFWFFFSRALDDRWESMVGDVEDDVDLMLADLTLASLETLSTEIHAEPDAETEWETGHEPWESAYRRDVFFAIDELSWQWGNGWGCYDDTGLPPVFDDGDCDVETISADDVPWASPEGDLELRSFGWKYLTMHELSLSWPIHDLIDLIWESQLERIAEHYGLGSDGLFPTLFDCSVLEPAIRTHFEDERSDFDDYDFTEAELDEVMEAFAPLCQELEANAAHFFAAAFKALTVDNDDAFATTDLDVELFHDDLEQRFLQSLEPDNYPADYAPWSPPLFERIEFDAPQCNHRLKHQETEYEICFEPAIEASD